MELSLIITAKGAQLVSLRYENIYDCVFFIYTEEMKESKILGEALLVFLLAFLLDEKHFLRGRHQG